MSPLLFRHDTECGVFAGYPCSCYHPRSLSPSALAWLRKQIVNCQCCGDVVPATAWVHHSNDHRMGRRPVLEIEQCMRRNSAQHERRRARLRPMITAPFTLQFPAVADPRDPTYVDISTTATALAGMPQDATLVLNCMSDVDAELQAGGGDNVITVRASAADTLRFRTKGIKATTVVVVQVSWL